jgi:hypothetical protein
MPLKVMRIHHDEECLQNSVSFFSVQFLTPVGPSVETKLGDDVIGFADDNLQLKELSSSYRN